MKTPDFTQYLVSVNGVGINGFGAIGGTCFKNFNLELLCEGCLVVRTGHGPQAEVAQVFGLELLVELGGRHLEGLEEEQRNGEEKETGEENNHHTTHKWTCMDGMTRTRQLEPRCDMRCINEMRSVCSGLSVVQDHVRDSAYVDHRVVLKVVIDVAIIYAVICS